MLYFKNEPWTYRDGLAIKHVHCSAEDTSLIPRTHTTDCNFSFRGIWYPLGFASGPWSLDNLPCITQVRKTDSLSQHLSVGNRCSAKAESFWLSPPSMLVSCLLGFARLLCMLLSKLWVHVCNYPVVSRQYSILVFIYCLWLLKSFCLHLSLGRK